MAKDDYIKFRCSTEFKKMVDEKAKELGMNVSNYMGMLIRKDMIDMMYVFPTDEMNDNQIITILDNKLAVSLNDEWILSKTDKITIGDITLNSDTTLEDYISWFDGGEIISLADNLEIRKEYVIDMLLGELYQPCDDTNKTYAESIYSSKTPHKEIEKLIGEFLLIVIDILMTEIKSKIERIQEDIEQDKLKWK